MRRFISRIPPSPPWGLGFRVHALQPQSVNPNSQTRSPKQAARAVPAPAEHAGEFPKYSPRHHSKGTPAICLCSGLGFRVQGLGFRVLGLGFRVLVSGPLPPSEKLPYYSQEAQECNFAFIICMLMSMALMHIPKINRAVFHLWDTRVPYRFLVIVV